LRPTPFHGSGEGAGDSMSGWTFVNAALVRAYNKNTCSTHIRGPLSKIEIKENIQAFVDEIHNLIIQNNNYQKTLNVLITQNIQEALLNAIGGKLDFSKCQIANISWKMDTSGQMTLHPTPINDPINIKDHETGSTIQIVKISASTLYRLLCVNIVINGKNHPQYFAIHKK
jgi:hypothetical protein